MSDTNKRGTFWIDGNRVLECGKGGRGESLVAEFHGPHAEYNAKVFLSVTATDIKLEAANALNLELAGELTVFAGYLFAIIHAVGDARQVEAKTRLEKVNALIQRAKEGEDCTCDPGVAYGTMEGGKLCPVCQAASDKRHGDEIPFQCFQQGDEGRAESTPRGDGS